MKKSHLRLVQIGSVLTLPVAVGWLLFQPGFEPVLAILTSVTAIVSTLFMRPEEQDKDKALPLTDECESVVGIQLDSLDVDSAETGSGGVEDFLKDYQVYFGGRHDEMAELDAWLTQPDKPFGLLVAPAGMGKSALVANWKKQLEDSATAVVVYHPISLRYGTNSQRQTLRSLLIQMSDAARKEAALEPKRPIAGLALIDESFNKEELRELCFHLSIDYDNLGDGGKRDKARELIELCQRENRLDDLTTLCQERSPYRNWDAAFTHSGHDQLLYEPPQEGDLSSRLKENLRKPTGWNKPLVVIVDGLDELDNQLNQPEIKKVDFLSSYVGEGIHVLAVARGEPDVDWKTWRDALGWERASVQRFLLGFLEEMNVREIAGRSLEISDGTLKPLAKKIYELSEGGDPLIVSLWIDWLKDEIDNKAVQVQPLLASLADCNPGANGYLKSILTRLQPVSEAAIPLFEVLSLARGPLMANDLLWLGVEINFRHLNELVNLSGRLIIKNAQEGYVFSHTRIRQAVQDKYVPKESTQRHYRLEQFHRYGRCALKQAKNAVDGKIPTVSPYLLSYYAEHLQEDKPSGYETSLYALVDEVWMKAHYEYSRSYDGFLDNVQRAWKVAEEVGKQIGSRSTLAIQFKCALVSSKAVSLSGHYLLPALLLRDELLRLPSQALAQIDLLPNIPDRIDAWLALLEIEEARKKLTPRLISQIVDRITLSLLLKEETQAKRFRKLCRLMALDETFDVTQIKNMKEVADGFTEPLWRAWGLSVILPLFSDLKDGIETIAKIIVSCLKIKERDAYSHLPYLYETFATNLPIDLFSTACQQAFADVDTLDRRDFFEQVAWEIPPEKIETFVTVLYEHLRYFPYIAELIANMAPKIDDEQAIHVANEFADRFKEVPEEYPWSPYRKAGWVYGAVGCGPVFIVLAAQRRDPAYKERLLDLAQSFIIEFGADELPLNQEDLWTLYRIVKGELSDEKVAALVVEDKFLRQYFKENRLNVYSHAVLYCLGTETITALFKPAIRPEEKPSDDGRYQWIDKSGYVLPLIASRFSDDEWPFISRIGSADFGLGYLRAADKNFCRLRLPRKFINDLFENWLGTDRVFGESDDVLNAICLTIAPYIKADDLLATIKKGSYWSKRNILMIFRMVTNPKLDPEVLRQLSLLPFASGEQELTADLYYIWVLRDTEKRKVLLKKLQRRYASAADCINQISFLSRLTATTKSLHNHWRLYQYHRQVERRLQGRGYKLWTANEKSLSIIWSMWIEPVDRFLELVACIGFFKALLETLYNALGGGISWSMLFLILMYQKIRGRKLDLMKEQERWKQLQSEIQRINQIQNTDERRMALAKFTDHIIDLDIAYPENVFQKYVLTAEKQNLWERFVYPEDALIVLENPRQHHLDFKAYPILIPAMVTRIDRTKYSLEMLLNAVSKGTYEVALHNFVLNQIVLAYFLEGDEQIQVIEAAIQNSQDFSWIEDEDVGNAIHALAYFVPQDLVSVILDWLQVFPSASILAVLAPKIIAHKDSEELLKQAISILERLSEKSPVHRFVCNIASELKGKDIAALIELVLKRDVPLRSQEINWGYGSQNPDQPLESYACLLKRWISLAENEETKSEAFVAWNLMLHSFSRRPCKDFFDHMQWFVEIVPKLGSEQDSVAIGETILEVGRWQW